MGFNGCHTSLDYLKEAIMGTQVLVTSYLLLTLSVLVVFSQDDGSGSGEDHQCEVSEWSAWSACVRSPACPRPAGPSLRGKAHRMGVTAGYDVGRRHMMQNVKAKTSVWQQRESCTKSHDCPQMDPHPTMGSNPCKEGLSDIYPCRNIDMMAFLNFKDLTGGIKLKSWGTPRGNDLWGWTDPEDGQEYALMGTTHGTSFVRITDPENPVVLAFLQTRTYRSIWRDIKVVGNYAYIGAESWDHGMQIFDLTRLRKMETFSEVKSDLDYLGLGNTHNVVANNDTNFIYLVGDRQSGFEHKCRGGLHMIDVSTPLKPKFVGCYDDDGYTHDAQCVVYKGPDRRYRGNEICFNYNEDSLTIVDVTVKDRPRILSKIGYDGSQYTHQGWLTEDHTILLMDDELDEYYSRSQKQKYTRTLVWDVSKLMTPKLVKDFWSHEQAIDHNQYIRGNFSYQSNYEAGLRIVHIDQSSLNFKEVAYFDVFPSRTAAKFGGTWSNYPYFKSGIIPVSSIEYGLFLVKPDMNAINEAVSSNVPYGEQQRMRQIEAAEDGGKCPHPVETKPCTPAACA